MNLNKTIDKAIEQKSLRVDGEFAYFEGYLSTFGNKDSYDDIVQKGAFKESLKNRIPALLYQHNTDIPVGVFEEIKEDKKGLWFKAKVPLTDQFVKERLLPQIQIGSLHSMSIGYITKNYTIDEKSGVRYLNEVILYEGSIVTIPANDQALIKSEQVLENIKALPKEELKNLFLGLKTLLKENSSKEDTAEDNADALWYGAMAELFNKY